MKIRQKAWKREIGFYVKSILEVFGVPKTALFIISHFSEKHFSEIVQNSDFLNRQNGQELISRKKNR